MSLLDDINPVHLAEKAWHKAEDLGADALHAVEKPLSSAATSVSNIDLSKIGHAFAQIGTALTHPVDTLTNLITAGEAKTIVKNITLVAELLNPATTSLALVQVANDKWISKDNKYSYEKVDTLDSQDESDLAAYWAEYDKETGRGNKLAGDGPKAEPDHVDFNSRDIYPAAKNKEQSDNNNESANGKGDSRQYINANGENAEVTVKPGCVDYKATRDGKVVTQAHQANGTTEISHDGETATLDTKLGKLTLSSEQVKLLQTKDSARVTLSSGSTLVRVGNEIELLDQRGNLLQTLEQDALTVSGDVQMFSSTAQMNNANSRANAEGRTTAFKPGSEISVQVATDGTALATLRNGTKIELRNDGTALIKSDDGHVLLVANHRTYFWRDGKFVDVDQDQNAGGAMIDSDGEVNAGGVRVNRHGDIVFAQGIIDLKNLVINFRNDMNQQRTVRLNHNTRGVRVDTDSATVVGAGDKAVTTTHSGDTVTTNIAAHQMSTKEVTVDAKEVHIHHAHSADTIVKANNEVEFDGGKGPVLYADGGMHLDEQTSVDAHGFVVSGNWSASASDSDGNAHAAGVHAAANLTGNVQSVATSAASVAMDVYSKAASGTVTYSDLNVLNQNMADVCALMSALAAAGNMDMVGQLQSSLSMLSDAIGFAAPKAQAAQIAMDRGQSSPFLIKAIEDGTWGRTPDQAVLAALAPAA